MIGSQTVSKEKTLFSGKVQRSRGAQWSQWAWTTRGLGW
jgi:hypothetical protein